MRLNPSRIFIFCLSFFNLIFSMQNEGTLQVLTALKQGKDLGHIKQIIAQTNVNFYKGIPFTLPTSSHHIERNILDCSWSLKRSDLFFYLLQKEKIDPFISALPGVLESPGISILLNQDRIFCPLIAQYIQEQVTDALKGYRIIKELLTYGHYPAIEIVLRNIKKPELKIALVNSIDIQGNPLLLSSVEKYLKFKDNEKKRSEYKKIIELLINSGARIDQPNALGKTPEQIVREQASELSPLFSKGATLSDAGAR